MKSTKKFVSILLSVLMLTSCLSATIVTADAAADNSALSSHYSTNADGKVGVNKSITVDGAISDWDSSMLIAQGAANDDPRVYRDNSMYEVPIDMYAMYGCWDDSNLYLMWEMTNVQDVVAPQDDYPLSQGVLYQTMNVPFFIAIDTGKSEDAVGNNGKLTTGGTLWNSNINVDESYNRMIAVSTNGANGPYVYSGDSTGLNPKEIYTAKTSGISFNYGLGLLSKNVYGIDGGYGVNHDRVVGDMCGEAADWVDFNTLGHKTDTMDFHYEMSIPLETLGITASDIATNGIGVMNIATMGKSGMDSLPYDTAMNDNADQADTESQAFNSFEKSDEDVVTAPFARIGGTAQPTTKPTQATTAPTTTPVTTQAATTEPVTDKTTVNATSNLFSSSSQVFESGTDTVTVAYDLQSAMNLVNGQWKLTYDSSKLGFDASKNSAIMPYISDGLTSATSGTISGNFSNVNLYDFTSSKRFVQVTFDVLKTGTANVNLDVQELSVGYLNNGILNYKNAVKNSQIVNLSSVSGFTGSSVTGTSKVTTDTPVTQQPTTAQATTQAVTQAATTQPQTNNLKVNATSNFFPNATQTYNEAEGTVTVSYKLSSSMNLINGQWKLTYDNTKLSYSDADNGGSSSLTIMPNIKGGDVINTKKENVIKGNFTSLGLYDFTTEKDFVTVTFKVIGTGETTVDLGVEILGIAYLNNDGEAVDTSLVDYNQVCDVSGIAGFENEKYTVKTVLSTPSVTPTQATTVAPTTAPTTQPTTAPVTQPTTPAGNLTVNATSNVPSVLAPVSQTYNTDDTVTVTYKIKSTMNFVNSQWTLTYDNTKLSYSNADNKDSNGKLTIMPNITGGAVINTGLTNRIKGNFTDLGLYDFTTEKDFVKVTFKAAGTGTTNVNLNMEYLSVAYLDNDGNVVDESIVDDSVLCDVTSKPGFENEVLTGKITLNKVDDVMYGDVNGDGVIDIDDATLIQRSVAEQTTLTDTQKKAADVTFDGVVDIDDATQIQRFVAEQIASFK